ncbi:cytochrome C [Vitiosangium sp. GDMCC 1.1324]|uniref:cytochrome C n=1 Tax=Vitiosangium sp. (strain GDMCC 1.1324) TaxID=2138576 RepID=UPI000D39C1DA|nr:cytochrome C [Vitiosangium sp. GDMCC 1.1324]PTL79438.1 cytochrome C [Vitiosangium sp. GDMCC 1.1324]
MRDSKLGRWRVLGLVLTAPLWGCAAEDGDGQDSERERIEKGFTLSPVSLNLEGKDRDLVGLGSYIVNAQAACNDCHTNPPFAEGGNPFLGQPEKINSDHFLAGGMSFGPGIVSPNITPDASGNPAGVDFTEFESLMRTGKEEDGGILQVMPWPIYKNMSDRELRAIYEYLRAIPHAEPAP